MNNRHTHTVVTEPPQSVQKWVKFIIHFLMLCILFILPEVLMSRSMPPGHYTPWPVYVNAVLYVCVFYLNYYVIIDRCMGQRRWLLRLFVWNMLLLAFTLSLTTFVGNRLGWPHPYPQHEQEKLHHEIRQFTLVLRDAGMVVLTVGLSLAMKLSENWMRMRANQQELEVAHQHEELTRLKSQLNPHFLFNTLNTIYALIAINPDTAQRAVHDLSRMLRYVLYENQPMMPLGRELEFVDNYVKLMRLRLGQDVKLNVTLDAGGYEDVEVAPLLLVGPVENAFKHGITGSSDDHIDISMTCRDYVLECKVSNRYDTSAHNNQPDGGIGNANLQRRLELIYGNRASLRTCREDGEYTVRLTIRLNTGQQL